MAPRYPEDTDDFQTLRDAYFNAVKYGDSAATYKAGVWHGKWEDDKTLGASKKPNRMTMEFVAEYTGWDKDTLVKELNRQVKHAHDRIVKSEVGWPKGGSKKDNKLKRVRATSVIEPIAAAWRSAMNIPEDGKKLEDVIYCMLLVAFTPPRSQEQRRGGSRSPAQPQPTGVQAGPATSISSADTSRVVLLLLLGNVHARAHLTTGH